MLKSDYDSVIIWCIKKINNRKCRKNMKYIKDYKDGDRFFDIYLC